MPFPGMSLTALGADSSSFSTVSHVLISGLRFMSDEMVAQRKFELVSTPSSDRVGISASPFVQRAIAKITYSGGPFHPVGIMSYSRATDTDGIPVPASLAG